MDDPSVPILPVNEIRDYHRINAHIAQLLDRGAARIRLSGVERQRLLVSGVRGPWQAVVEIDGTAGPELAADLDAPNLLVIARRGATEGAGRGLRSGALAILQHAGDGLAYRQSGGMIAVLGPVGHRAGLELRGGLLYLGGPTGRLAAERQSGGRIFAWGEPVGPFAGYARRGGRWSTRSDEADVADRHLLAPYARRLVAELGPGSAAPGLASLAQIAVEAGGSEPDSSS